MNEEKKTNMLSYRITDKEYREIEQVAKKEERSVSDTCRRMITWCLEFKKKQERQGEQQENQ